MSYRVLVVEDEPHIQTLVKRVLEREGYEVEAASDGLEALKLVEAHCPDAIVLDVMIPELSGFAVLQRLKSSPRTENVPVIVLTARSGVADVTDGILLGADAYLTKPFDPFELLTFLSRLLGSPDTDE